MKEFNFNSQVCTDKNQSERLIALGLKKETADMSIEPDLESIYEAYYISAYPPSKRGIPAWSLHRLWCLLPHSITIVTHFEYGRQYRAGLDLTMDSYQNVCYLEGVDEPYYDRAFCGNDAYESICKAIEWLIKEGYFNKEYLV